jgi:GAF domain-containing protein
MAALQLGAMLDGNRIADELWEMVELAPDAMLHRAILRINEVGPPYDWVGVYLLNEDLLILHSYIGEHTECTRIPVGEGVCGIAVAEARDINVPDVEAFKGYMACSFNARSEIVTLIRDGPSPSLWATSSGNTSRRHASAARKAEGPVGVTSWIDLRAFKRPGTTDQGWGIAAHQQGRQAWG